MPRLPSSLFDDSVNSSDDGVHGRDHACSAYPQTSTVENTSVRSSLNKCSMSSRSNPFARSSPPKGSQRPDSYCDSAIQPVAQYDVNTGTDTDTDTTRHRMKAWGFPGPPRQKSLTPTKEKDQRRESFFGLSSTPTPPCEREDYGVGVDLPPFFSGHYVPPSPEVVTPKPTPTSTLTPPSIDSSSDKFIEITNDVLVNGPTSAEPLTSTTLDTLWERAEPFSSSLSESTKVNHHRHDLDLDFTLVCRCCVGQVFVV